MGRILGLVNGVWATAQERKMHAIRQRFNLYAGGSLSADVRRFFQLINADEVLGTHRGLFQMAVDMRPLTREELVRSLPRELERLARSLLGRLRTERLGIEPAAIGEVAYKIIRADLQAARELYRILVAGGGDAACRLVRELAAGLENEFAADLAERAENAIVASPAAEPAEQPADVIEPDCDGELVWCSSES
jgi:hypothetical protein